jgi:hypothetical protein
LAEPKHRLRNKLSFAEPIKTFLETTALQNHFTEKSGKTTRPSTIIAPVSVCVSNNRTNRIWKEMFLGPKIVETNKSGVFFDLLTCCTACHSRVEIKAFTLREISHKVRWRRDAGFSTFARAVSDGEVLELTIREGAVQVMLLQVRLYPKPNPHLRNWFGFSEGKKCLRKRFGYFFLRGF